jgi:hypothetical protein
MSRIGFSRGVYFWDWGFVMEGSRHGSAAGVEACDYDNRRRMDGGGGEDGGGRASGWRWTLGEEEGEEMD